MPNHPTVDHDGNASVDLRVYCHGLTGEQQQSTLHLGKIFIFHSGAVASAHFSETGGERQGVRLEGQHVWIVGAQTRYAVEWPEHASVVSIVFDVRFLSDAVGENAVFGATVHSLAKLGTQDLLIRQLVDAFRPLCQPNTAVPSRYIECMGRVLATRILQLLHAPPLPIDRGGGLPPDALQKVTTHIHENLRQGFDKVALAKIAGYSPDHFARLFKTSMDVTPKEYFIQCQVYKAAELAKTTRMKISDIAYEVGFANESVLAKWFRRILKKRPSDLRR